MIKKGIQLFTVGCVFVFMLSSCSYKEFEDSLKNEFEKKSKVHEEYSNPAAIPGETIQDSTEDTGIYYPGDTVVYSYEEGKEIQYTVDEVKVVSNINDVGLLKEDFVDSTLIAEDGSITARDSGDKNFLLLVDVTIKNLSIDKDDQQYNGPPLQVEMWSGSKSGILMKDGPFLNEAIYFSGHPEIKEENKDYYGLNLDVGQEMTTVMGWIISSEEWEEPYYYVMKSAASAEEYLYFCLNQKKEGE